jgi:membrane protease YdiL (CAAX protease family)
MVILGMLSLLNSSFIPSVFTEKNKLGVILEGLAIGFFGGGLFEEIGWTGFVLPKMLQKHRPTISGIIIGFLWALWHIYPTYFGSGDINGNFSFDLFIPPLVFYMLVLPAYRILMVWLFVRTKSMLVTMLAHMSLTANTIFILMPDVSSKMLSLYYFILAAILWLIVALTNKKIK